MKTLNAPSFDIAQLMGSNTSDAEAIAMLRIIGESGYNDTDDIPEDAWFAMIAQAVQDVEEASRQIGRLDHIEVVEDNSGGITIQNTHTRQAANYPDMQAALPDITRVNNGDDMSGWDTTDEFFIDAEEYRRLEGTGGLRKI